MKYDIIHLNNKTRKGTYLYVKEEGSPSRYFKYSGMIGELDALLNYYEDTFVKKSNKGTVKQYKERYGEEGVRSLHFKKDAEKYIKKIKKEGNLNHMIKKGISTSGVSNILSASTGQIKQAKIDLLKDLVIDKNNIGNLIKEENMKKLKMRMEHRITFKDSEGVTLFKAKKFGLTLDKVRKEIKGAVKTGETVQTEERYGGAIQKLKNMNYDIGDGNKAGQVSSVSVETIFRKGK